MPADKHGTGPAKRKRLHTALKEWYAQPDDRVEAPVEGFVIDIVRGDLLIEIQTRSFAAIRRKLEVLTVHHPVRLVYPIARERWIVKIAEDGRTRSSRRKSPKRGSFEDLFEELVSFPQLLASANLSLEVLLIQEEELRQHEPGRAWRRKGWVVQERQLLDVVDRRLFERPADLTSLLPSSLEQPFTTADLAAAIHKRRRLAQRMAYCLRETGQIVAVGKQGRAIRYARAAE
jgi:hypothetical protein